MWSMKWRSIVNPSGNPIAWSKASQPSLAEIGKIRAVLLVRPHMTESGMDYDTKLFSITCVDSHIAGIQ